MEPTVSLPEQLLCRTRTGVKIHAAYPGSSVTHCGHWLKVNSVAMQVPTAAVVSGLRKGEIRNPSSLGPATLVLCNHCFPVEAARTADSVEARFTWSRSS